MHDTYERNTFFVPLKKEKDLRNIFFDRSFDVRNFKKMKGEIAMTKQLLTAASVVALMAATPVFADTRYI